MPYDRQSLHITCTGQLGTGGGAGEEIFSFGFRASGLADFDAAGALDGLDVPAIAVLCGEYFQDATLHLHQDAHLFKVKVAAISTTGHYIEGADPVEAEPDPGGVHGSDSTIRHPNQIAVCISTRTNTTVGRATRGRFFLPLPADGVNVTGKVDAARATARAELTASFFTSLNTELEAGSGDDSNLCIMSNSGAGRTLGITKIRVGTVLDTIRSRRNALSEDYSADVAVS